MTQNITQGGVVEDVGSVFSAYVENDNARERIGDDLAERGLAEVLREFAEAEKYFRGFCMGTEHLNYGIYLAACEALDTARKARRAAESHLQDGGW